MKNVIKKLMVPFAGILRMVTAVLCMITKTVNYNMYKFAFFSGKTGKSSRWFDHDIDVYYLWDKNGETGWLERGCFSQLAIEMFEMPFVLELGCGDGFYTKKYYSKYVNSNNKRRGGVKACHISKDPNRTACRKYSGPNIEYMVRDFLHDMPDGKFTNVVWDASMNFFKESEIRIILAHIKEKLASQKGILSGSTVLNAKWEYYRTEFSSPMEVKRILCEYFENVTMRMKGNQLYFYASDGTLPLLFTVRPK